MWKENVWSVKDVFLAVSMEWWWEWVTCLTQMMSHHSYFSCDLQILGEKDTLHPHRTKAPSSHMFPTLKKSTQKTEDVMPKPSQWLIYTHSHTQSHTYKNYGKWGRVSGLQHDWLEISPQHGWLIFIYVSWVLNGNNVGLKHLLMFDYPRWCHELLILFQILKHKRTNLLK